MVGVGEGESTREVEVKERKRRLSGGEVIGVRAGSGGGGGLIHDLTIFLAKSNLKTCQFVTSKITTILTPPPSYRPSQSLLQPQKLRSLLVHFFPTLQASFEHLQNSVCQKYHTPTHTRVLLCNRWGP